MDPTFYSGLLSLVGTPIGNLGDISIRALEVLRGCEAVLAEDTRQTHKLLNHYGIRKPLVAFHEHSSVRDRMHLVERLTKGAHFALVTDAGMPGVSDPGAKLICNLRQVAPDVRIEVVPGPSAVTAAVALSGYSGTSFGFIGFFPRMGKARAEAVAYIGSARMPVMFFESPHRLRETLQVILGAVGPARHVWIFRELTKRFEEVIQGEIGGVIDKLKTQIKGEITVMVDASSEPVCRASEEHTILWQWARRMVEGGARPKIIARDLSVLLNQPTRVLYARLIQGSDHADKKRLS